MNPLMRLQVEQGITLRHVAPKTTDGPPTLKEANLPASTLDGVKRSNEFTLNKLNEPIKTSSHERINSKASNIGNDVNKSIDTNYGNTNLIKTASSSSEINKQMFKCKAVSTSLPPQIVSDAMVMRANQGSRMAELSIRIQSDKAKTQMLVAADNSIEVLTNKLELWDRDSVDHPQKDSAMQTLVEFIQLSDDLKNNSNNLSFNQLTNQNTIQYNIINCNRFLRKLKHMIKLS